MRKLFVALPLILSGVLIIIFSTALLSGRNAQTIPSALLNQKAPTFTAHPIMGLDMAGLTSEDLNRAEHQVTLLNIWASWCTPCIAEHPFITELAGDKNVRLVGINYKDKPKAAIQFLQNLGNPYQQIGVDEDGTIAIDFGVYGVPETYLIDHKGIIRYKVVGPVTPEIIERDLRPLIKELTQAE